jgi:hypothetical protein
MTPLVFASVIEGHGEEEALRVLITTILAAIVSDVYPIIARPFRVPWGTLVNVDGELERYAEMAIRDGGPTAKLIVVLDADDRCPAELGPQLLQRVKSRFPNNPASVNVADREYESWFIASSESIAHHVGSNAVFEVPSTIEEIRNAKGWLARNVLNRSYKEIGDQAAFSSIIDVPVARQRSQSFDRFCREVERLLSPSGKADDGKRNP